MQVQLCIGIQLRAGPVKLIPMSASYLRKVIGKMSGATSSYCEFLTHSHPPTNDSIKLIFAVQFPKGYIPDIAIASKLFNDLKIDFDSQTINSTSAQYVLFN